VIQIRCRVHGEVSTHQRRALHRSFIPSVVMLRTVAQEDPKFKFLLRDMVGSMSFTIDVAMEKQEPAKRACARSQTKVADLFIFCVRHRARSSTVQRSGIDRDPITMTPIKIQKAVVDTMAHHDAATAVESTSIESSKSFADGTVAEVAAPAICPCEGGTTSLHVNSSVRRVPNLKSRATHHFI
jgi:hypothetical protein